MPCSASYSMYPNPLCLLGTPVPATSQAFMVPKAENTDFKSSAPRS